MDPLYNLFITPIYLCLIYFVIAPYFAKRWTNKYTRKYFWWGLTAKMFGAISFCLIYQFYYGYGDTIAYFKQSIQIINSFYDSFSTGINVFFYKKNSLLTGRELYYLNNIIYKRDDSTWIITKISAIISIFTFKSFYSTSLFFSLWSYLGLFKLLTYFTNKYKKNYKVILSCTLFIPSCIFWSSGILKESILTGSISFITYYTLELINKNKREYYKIFILFILVIVVFKIKSATIITLIPCLIIFIIQKRLGKTSKIQKVFVLLIFILFTPLFLIIYQNQIINNLETSEEFITAKEKINGFQGDHGSRIKGHGGGEASTYHLKTSGDISIIGLLKAVPEAVIVTLFRPFPWEAKKIVQLFGALESFVYLFMFILLLLKKGIVNIIKKTYNNPEIFLCISYTIIFGFIAGYISFNFGVLQRFKTPIMPFFTLFLILNFINLKRFYKMK
ncbi:hypothetical protein KMW28_10875 [Flammeovirga yaeyamensis]|uniref:Glycosyltransferase RgtA/B/C/D-like domain-containing protein n=1 Tax=Flammeovirga yaeyamensis TaxID=367791 RepID=A0AAX1MY24_9BACT|nr:hypothetical protein [Flammeovirga yaeyamensis]MBB3696341.1 hypothetical protein [Flammeovirga yaeyamensis]NMF35020.1 hypothetical protein [Flammeovirga yaeyamensis]QWG00154.1 hypothetical protein KMW28_10875 [Flammeovirga yaeyamensis]